MTPDFDAAAFLSNLSTRFQTLEDLQTELRELSQSLNKELVDLVNDNYQDFLTLGRTLRGGDEKVEDIRIGLLVFQRDVAGLKVKLDTRRETVQAMLNEKRIVMTEIEKGRLLLDIAGRLEALERQLGLAKAADGVANGTSGEDRQEMLSSDSEDDADDAGGVSTRTKRRVEQYLIMRLLMGKYDSGHPFLQSQQERVDKAKVTMLTDLDALSKQAQSAQVRQDLLHLRRVVGEH